MKRGGALALASALTLGVLTLTLAFIPSAFAAEGGASWRFAPAAAPPPPPGAQASPYGVALGNVGDIRFWAPNRGVLITAGTRLVPAGLYSYDGVSWHQLATVCGGTDGRIAWASPEEFWTISDQRPGQDTSIAANYSDVSLCHFKDGQVVGSYALPLNQPDSYLPMDAAACRTPNDCWFGGELGQPPNSGAFHLHWDGSNVTVVYSPEGHAITSMALASQGLLLESMQLAPGDFYGSEDPNHPPVLEQLAPPGSGAVFHPFPIRDPSCDPSVSICFALPSYGTDEDGHPVEPDTLGGLQLSSDFSPAAPGPAQTWALAGPNDTPLSSSSRGRAHPLALRFDGASWSQVLGGADPGGDDPFNPGEVPGRLAAEPGAPAAWVTIQSNDSLAHVDRLTAAGTLSETDVLGTAQGVGKRGNAGPVACPGPHDCWLASDQGWLFHLSDGAQLPQDSDPAFQQIITYRPFDGGTPQIPPDDPPADDSLANQAPPVPPPATPTVQVSPASGPLVEHVRSRVVKHGMLVLTFTLTAPARVRLLARRKGRVVASTRTTKMRAGKGRVIKLRLNPRRWPTKLDLRATPEHPASAPSSGSASTGSDTSTPNPTNNTAPGKNSVST
ncbi:MAG TPA: hypothetical protein VLJ42_07690 [Solirubrobacteraceae bacterium]|nr:hypothetical protein [Solirubrobacteraceae bacterium]